MADQIHNDDTLDLVLEVRIAGLLYLKKNVTKHYWSADKGECDGKECT